MLQCVVLNMRPRQLSVMAFTDSCHWQISHAELCLKRNPSTCQESFSSAIDQPSTKHYNSWICTMHFHAPTRRHGDQQSNISQFSITAKINCGKKMEINIHKHISKGLACNVTEQFSFNMSKGERVHWNFHCFQNYVLVSLNIYICL